MVVAVIDDHRIVTLLASGEAHPGRYATTCSWWWRLTSALAGRRAGALSGRLALLGPAAGAMIERTISVLPRHLEIVDLRCLSPAMGALAQDRAINQLAAEAVAAAAFVDTGIEVEVEAPLIRGAAGERGIGYVVIGAG